VAVTISLLNMKGGVGKTTLAVNLAWHMHTNEGKNVLLVDLDPQFNSTQYVMDFKAFESHRKNNGTISDLLLEQPQLTLITKKLKNKPSLAIHNIDKTGGKRFDLLPADLNLAWVVKNPAQMDYKLEKVLKKIGDGYDYIFVDCAPTDSVLTTMALTASDYLLIPMKPDRFSILGFTNLIETIKTFRERSLDPHGVKILGIVFTQTTNSSTVEQGSILDIGKAASKENTYVFTSHLHHSNSFIRSVKNQTPIFATLYTQHKAKTAASKIAEEMEKRISSLSGSGKGKK
jgi:chromosome partitioning protein